MVSWDVRECCQFHGPSYLAKRHQLRAVERVERQRVFEATHRLRQLLRVVGHPALAQLPQQIPQAFLLLRVRLLYMDIEGGTDERCVAVVRV